MVITGLFKAEQRLLCPAVQKYSCWNLSRVVFPPLQSWAFSGKLNRCYSFQHRMVWEHFSSALVFCVPQRRHCTLLGSLVQQTLLLVPSLGTLPTPVSKVTLHGSFLSFSLVFNTHFIISSLSAVASTASTAPEQGIAEPTWSSQEQDEEEQ